MAHLKNLPFKLPIGRGSMKGRMVRFSERDGLRPTPARVREAVFSMLTDYVGTHGFLDACAGSGLMGFTAASCGFKPVVVTESNRDTHAELAQNNEALGLPVGLYNQNVLQVSRLPLELGPWICFADPPFKEQKFHIKLMTRLLTLARFDLGSLYVAEHEAAFEPPEGFTLLKSKRYGRTHISLFEKVLQTDRFEVEAEAEPEAEPETETEPVEKKVRSKYVKSVKPEKPGRAAKKKA